MAKFEAFQETLKSQQETLKSQKKQIKKLFAINTSSKMRAFCIKGVHGSENEDKTWDPGRNNSRGFFPFHTSFS